MSTQIASANSNADLINDDENSIDVDYSNKNILFNYFPNEPTKHIDYVIYYKEAKNTKSAQRWREKFFDALESEGFQLYTIKKDREGKENIKVVYKLLHCSLERLMEEAERIQLEVPLKDFYLNDRYQGLLSCDCLKRIKNFVSTPVKREEIDYVSAPFEADIRFIFKGFEKEISKCKGFANSVRCLLVDSILKTMNFDIYDEDLAEGESTEETSTIELPIKYNHIVESVVLKCGLTPKDGGFEQKVSRKLLSYSGLSFMLNKKYFDDAFILHDDTNDLTNKDEIVLSLMKSELFTDVDNIETFKRKLFSKRRFKIDKRTNLNNTWALFHNVLKLQPLWKIRNYVGEYCALYFAWCGSLIATLWFPTLVGLAFFVAGLLNSLESNKELLANATLTDYNYYLSVFADSFDGTLTVPFAIIICLWGAVFTEYWNRQCARLAYEWDTESFEKFELDRIEYAKKLRQYCAKMGDDSARFPEYIKILKYLVSFLILLLMIGIVAIDIAAVVVFRIYIKTKTFANNETGAIIIGDIGSTVINAVLIIIMNKIYSIVALKLTKWENPRTQTEFEDSLVLKLFAFQFVNSYGSLFYIAFFRNLDYENGYFNLGAEYIDKCNRDNCMELLTIQVFVLLLIKPVPRFLLTVIWPFIYSKYQRYKLRRNIQKQQLVGAENGRPKSVVLDDEYKVFVYVSTERKKPVFDGSIQEEYMEKVLMYGYIMLFACSFSLGPLLFIITLLIDLRVDAASILWVFRRPVAYKAQDIGVFYYILQFINVCGIVSNAFIIAFTSQWSKEILISLDNRLICVVVFEHIIFLIWILIYILPDTSTEVLLKMRQEALYAKEMVIAAKESLDDDPVHTNRKKITESDNVKRYKNVLKSRNSKKRNNDNQIAKADDYSSIPDSSKEQHNSSDQYEADESTDKKPRRHKSFKFLATKARIFAN